MDLIGFTDEEILALGDDELTEDDEPGEAKEPKGNLSDRFMIPPISVLNAREGWWQNRKKAWLAIGIKSELGRGDATGTAAPGGGLLPAMKQAGHINGSKPVRGNGAGRPING